MTLLSGSTSLSRGNQVDGLPRVLHNTKTDQIQKRRSSDNRYFSYTKILYASKFNIILPVSLLKLEMYDIAVENCTTKNGNGNNNDKV